MPHRRIKSSILKRAQKYLDVVSKQWTHQNIDHQMEQVKIAFDKNLPHREKMINELDKSITNLLKHTEKNAPEHQRIQMCIGAQNLKKRYNI